MSEPFTVAGNSYKARKMPAMTQFHVARRLAPILGALMEAVPASAMDGKTVDLAKIDGLKMMEPIAQVISTMSDADSEYILNACLEACDRQQPGDAGWGPVKAKGSKAPQYSDIDMPAMLQIAWKVIQENLGAFFPAPPPISAEQE